MSEEKIRFWTDQETGLESVIIDKGDGHFVAMLKTRWDELEAAKEQSGSLS